MRYFSAFCFCLFAALLTAQTVSDSISLRLCTRFWGTGGSVPGLEIPPKANATLLPDGGTGTCRDMVFSPASAIKGYCPSGFRASADTCNGLTILDAGLISKNILYGSALRGYAFFSADINQSGTLTSYDGARVLRKIWGLPDSLWTFPSWRFLPDSALYGPSPFGGLYCTGFPYIAGQQTAETTLHAIKVGDVDGDANPNGPYQVPANRPAKLLLPDLTVRAGTQVAVPVRIGEDWDYEGLQLELAFDTSACSLVDSVKIGVLSYLLDDGLFYQYTDHAFRKKGAFRIAEMKRLTISPLQLIEGFLLFTLYIEAKRDFQLREVVRVANEGCMPGFLVSYPDFVPQPFELSYFTVPTLEAEGASVPVFGSPMPNPFREAVYLPASLPKAGDFWVELRDPLGRLLWEKHLSLPAGESNVELPAESVPSGQTVFYRVWDGKGKACSGKILRY